MERVFRCLQKPCRPWPARGFRRFARHFAGSFVFSGRIEITVRESHIMQTQRASDGCNSPSLTRRVRMLPMGHDGLAVSGGRRTGTFEQYLTNLYSSSADSDGGTMEVLWALDAEVFGHVSPERRPDTRGAFERHGRFAARRSTGFRRPSTSNAHLARASRAKPAIARRFFFGSPRECGHLARNRPLGRVVRRQQNRESIKSKHVRSTMQRNTR